MTTRCAFGGMADWELLAYAARCLRRATAFGPPGMPAVTEAAEFSAAMAEFSRRQWADAMTVLLPGGPDEPDGQALFIREVDERVLLIRGAG